MSELSDGLAGQGVRFQCWAGPGRMIGRRDAHLVALTEDRRTELWRFELPGQKEGYVIADERTVLWNERGERWTLVVVAAADGRQRYALEGERARMLDGDRFLTIKGDGTASLRKTESGEAVVSLRGLSQDMLYVLSPDRRWLAAGRQPIQLWDLEAASIRHSLGDSDITTRLEFTPDSSALLVLTTMTPQSGMQDEVTERKFDVRSGALVEERSWWERQ